LHVIVRLAAKAGKIEMTLKHFDELEDIVLKGEYDANATAQTLNAVLDCCLKNDRLDICVDIF